MDKQQTAADAADAASSTAQKPIPMLTPCFAPGKLESVNGLHHGTGTAAMLGKEVTYDKADIQECIERLRDRLAASLNASRNAVRLTEEGWFYRKGDGDWQRVPWVLYTVDPTRRA